MTTDTVLPLAINDYFIRMDGADKLAVIDLFTPLAVVTDDGRSYQGHAEITTWLGAAASEYTYTSTRLATQRVGDTVIVTTRLEGNFPGGTVDLRNVFTLDASGLISRLLITV